MVVSSFFLYQRIVETITAETNKQAKAVAFSVSKFIEKDIKEYDKLSSVLNHTESLYGSDYYKTMSSLLEKIKTETGAKFIYTEKRLSDEEVAYILDAEEPENENHSSLGSREKISELEKSAFTKTKGSLSGAVIYEKWGKLFSAFAPIWNINTGKISGLVGVDFSPVYVEKNIKKLKILIIIGFLGAILLTGAVIKMLFSLISMSRNLNTDYMTKLYNRRCYDSSIKKAIEKGHPFSLMVIDIDNFKIVNDSFGHVAGDNALKEIADLIKESTRNEDLCFRYGGDEFVVILPNTAKEQAELIGEKIQSATLSCKLSTEGPNEFNVSLSVGVAQWEDGMSPQDLTELADKAMYSSKNLNKKRTTIL
jgi:diguanylate cyclase (GGDEF)-like protein